MEIREGIGEEFRAQAAEIYWLAFRMKLIKVLGPDEKGRAYFERSLVLDHAMIAYEGDELLGIAGFDAGEGGLISDDMRSVFRIYGISAIWRMMALSVFSRLRLKNSLQMDGIAVTENARGKGVGSALLEAIFAKAKASNCRYIYLDVIDSNPRARALYERHGFEAIKTEKLGMLSKVFNFESSTRMVKSI